MSISKQISAMANDKRAKAAAAVLAGMGVAGTTGAVGYTQGKKKGAATALNSALPVMKKMNQQENAAIAQHFYNKGVQERLGELATYGTDIEKKASSMVAEQMGLLAPMAGGAIVSGIGAAAKSPILTALGMIPVASSGVGALVGKLSGKPTEKDIKGMNEASTLSSFIPGVAAHRIALRSNKDIGDRFGYRE